MIPGTGFSRFIKIGKWLKRNKVGWLKEGEEYDDAINMRTAIKLWGENLGSAGVSDLGQLQMNYYVSFKSRRYTGDN